MRPCVNFHLLTRNNLPQIIFLIHKCSKTLNLVANVANIEAFHAGSSWERFLTGQLTRAMAEIRRSAAAIKDPSAGDDPRSKSTNVVRAARSNRTDAEQATKVETPKKKEKKAPALVYLDGGSGLGPHALAIARLGYHVWAVEPFVDSVVKVR